MSEARLEKPDEIISSYLVPAIKALNNNTEGSEAGQVFHEFAIFCDQQLQNAEYIADFERIQQMRERKEGEVRTLELMLKSAPSQSKERDSLKSALAKAIQWYDLDDREFQRLKDGRETFLRRSLENYLLGLKACDDYDNDVSRFSALWLEFSDSNTANDAVSTYIDHVASWKFASLMNQWTSRLLDQPNAFQAILIPLVLRICVEHPFHGMYQIFASSKTKGGKDRIALARNAAALNVVNQLRSDKRSSPTWIALHNLNINFVRFASEKLKDSESKPGSKMPLRKLHSGSKMEQDAIHHRLPPTTMHIPLRPDGDYSKVPTVAKFHPEFTIASGVSVPKILTAVGSDGQRYKQLVRAIRSSPNIGSRI